jgi:aromatic-L-amino-acid/L-tryptophan decarboxylase
MPEDVLAPASINVVCFRYAPVGVTEDDLNAINEELLLRLQEQGIAVPSSTVLHGRFALRVAIVNHRSRREDFDDLLDGVRQLGAEIIGQG